MRLFKRAIIAIAVAAVVTAGAAAPANASPSSDEPVVTRSVQVFLSEDGFTAAPIQPMALGCTGAPGGFGNICLTTNMSGSRMISARVAHNNTTQNMCNMTAELRYTLASSTGITVQTGFAGGCTPLTKWVNFSKSVNLRSGTSICARIKDDATGGLWTNQACHGVG
ncbi:hypothetical protein [Oerskovia enterophila]|uniref:Uncharacterized protein n=1 Tax=Oerskovia enterophila TaxID=43678 RepID=A0ABX2Y8D7_9CELL|nr:hypothetical protein [Oerskovia enterophila]OCI32779.1 hypothetical protein OERS_03710 [Oerskovia enterophila]